jgi:phosphopantothenoylcysteine decarboxylase/phosphopantothenate--cysteine ligase
MQDLQGKRLVLGMSGGIACYKIAELTRRLVEQGAEVDVVMTEAATHFITPVTMQALSGRPVSTDQWDARVPNNMAHINLSRGADAIVVAPASADLIAKITNGLANDLLSTLCVARACPLLVAPAMNVEMWDNPATQRNIATLKADGVKLLGPATGDQACGESGMGRMLEPHELLEDIIAAMQPKVLQDKHVLITAGPTYEPIDPVRGITNRSSGKMGFAIARAAREAGAKVTLIAGPTSLPTPRRVRRVDVQTGQEMLDEVMGYVNRCDVFIAVAAVADWRVANPSKSKIKKQGSDDAPRLEFVQTTDILATVSALQGAPYCVGFAAESEDVEQLAQAKRKRKAVPMLVANRVQDAFGRDDNELLVLDDQGVVKFERASKLALARRLIAEIARRID